MERVRICHFILRLTLALLLLLVTTVLQALPVRFYDAEQLSSNQITSICQDRQGYIWVGTEYGLNKFDGAFFKQYYHDDENVSSLSDDIVRQLMTGRDGSLWVVSNQGVQRYNRLTDSFDAVSFKMAYGNDSKVNVNDLLETPDGHVWLLHADEGVFEVDSGSLTAYSLSSINKNLMKGAVCDNMLFDSKARLWISYRDEGLLMVNTKNGQTRYYDKTMLGGSRAVDIAEDAKGRVTVVTYSSLLQLDEQAGSFSQTATFPRCMVHRLFKDNDGRLLIGTSGSGLLAVSPSAREVQQVESFRTGQMEPLQAKVFAYLEDRHGNRWIGCQQKGLLLVTQKSSPFHYQRLRNLSSDNGNVLRSVFADSKHHLYVCQEKGGITGISHSGQVLVHWLNEITVMTMAEDAAGILWAGTYRNGLFRIDPTSGREQHIAATGDKRIGGITFDRQGNLYIASFNDGLYSFTPDGQTHRPLGKGCLKLHNNYLNTLFTDRDGRIWVGHYYGLDVYNPQTDRLFDISVPEALRPAVVYAIAQSPHDQSIWVGSSKGLFQYYTQGGMKGQWKRFTTRQGLPNNIVCNLVVTADGTIWVSTYRGMAKIEVSGIITSYYRGNGLEEWSYLRGVGTRSASGEVIFGHQNGITYFVPEKITKDEFREGIMLTGMRLGDADVNASTLSDGHAIINCPLEEATDISVSYLDNTFSLRFSPMDFRVPAGMHYEFRFEDEAADQWYRTESGRSELFFSHLSVGTHKLLVRACDNGVYSPEKSITIRVLPPWWRTWWAYAFYLLVLASIGYLWWRSYWNRRQAETNEEKIRFFVDVSHELRSPLTLIKSPLEQLLAGSPDAQQTRALRSIERNTNRLLTLTDEILSIRKIEKGQLVLHPVSMLLGDFVGDICRNYDYLLEKRKIELIFNNQDPDLAVSIDPGHFDKVVNNLLTNAIKYVRDGGHIAVNVSRTREGKAELKVSDDGEGIDEQQLRKVFERFYQASARPASGLLSYGIGLNLTQKIVTLHQGTITARNRNDVEHGSEFVVTLPVAVGERRVESEERRVKSEERIVESEERNATALFSKDRPKAKVRRKTTYRVAVVDDDEDMCDYLKTELSETYHVQTYHDGRKALEGIVNSVPDLVVSDVVMPVMDGIELLHRLKSSTNTSHIPVILLTTKTEMQSRISGLEHGADAYMDKPFNLEELEARIGGLIANRLRVRGKVSGMQEQTDNVRKVELKGNDEQLMERIMKAVNARLDDSDFNVEALAEEVGLSRVQLHRRMKELTGISVGEFIRNLRLQQAAKLLAAGDTTIAQVTYAVGFANPTHFTTAFKKHFGVTPSEYMAKHKEE